MCNSPLSGSRLGWAEKPPGSVPSRSEKHTDSSSSVSSKGGVPASTSAHVRPAWPMTLVFGPMPPIPCRGPGTFGHPFASAMLSPCTKRLRYHFADPPSRRMPCTIPVPVNQWYVAGSGSTGLGPLRRYRPRSASGMWPVTGRS